MSHITFIDPADLPDKAVSEVFTVANEAAMLALTAETGDWAKRTDTGRVYMLKADDPATLSNWEFMGVFWEEKVDTFIIDSTDLSNGYVDLTLTPLPDGKVELTWGGAEQKEGTAFDLIDNGSGLVKRIDFTGLTSGSPQLAVGDVICIEYKGIKL